MTPKNPPHLTEVEIAKLRKMIRAYDAAGEEERKQAQIDGDPANIPHAPNCRCCAVYKPEEL